MPGSIPDSNDELRATTIDLREQLRRQTIHLKIMITLSQATLAAIVWFIARSA